MFFACGETEFQRGNLELAKTTKQVNKKARRLPFVYFKNFKI